MTSWLHSEFNWPLVWVLLSQLDDTGPQLLILQKWKTHIRMFGFSLDLLYNRILLKYSWKSLFETTVTTSSKIENNLSFIVLIQVIQWDISGSFTCQSTCFIIILNMGKLYYDNYARPSICSFLFLTVIFFKDDFQLLIWKNCRTKNGDLDRFVLHYFFLSWSFES